MFSLDTYIKQLITDVERDGSTVLQCHEKVIAGRPYIVLRYVDRIDKLEYIVIFKIKDNERYQVARWKI